MKRIRSKIFLCLWFLRLFLWWMYVLLTNLIPMCRWLFVTEEDIKSLPGFQVCPSYFMSSANLKTFLFTYISTLTLLPPQNQTLIAVKAPHGTTLEVPDPDEVRLFQQLWKTSGIYHFLSTLTGGWPPSKEIQDHPQKYNGSYWRIPC